MLYNILLQRLRGLPPVLPSS